MTTHQPRSANSYSACDRKDRGKRERVSRHLPCPRPPSALHRVQLPSFHASSLSMYLGTPRMMPHTWHPLSCWRQPEPSGGDQMIKVSSPPPVPPRLSSKFHKCFFFNCRKEEPELRENACRHLGTESAYCHVSLRMPKGRRLSPNDHRTYHLGEGTRVRVPEGQRSPEGFRSTQSQ